MLQPSTRQGISPLIPAAAMIVLETARRAREADIGQGEERVFRLANEVSDDIEFPAWVVMQSGSLAAVFVAAAELKRQGKDELAMTALVAGVSVWAGIKILKPAIGRGRPQAKLEAVAVRGHAQTGLGYPSGHAAVALTLATVITRSAGPTARSAAVAIAGAAGVARMYVGAHLPLDIAGGLGIGLLCGRAANALSRSFLTKASL